MDKIKADLKKLIDGDVSDNAKLREEFSHDASMFELVPELVVSPKNSKDIQKLVKYVSGAKKTNPELSITARSAGTDMSGGAITESIVLNMKKYFTEIKSVNSNPFFGINTVQL